MRFWPRRQKKEGSDENIFQFSPHEIPNVEKAVGVQVGFQFSPHEIHPLGKERASIGQPSFNSLLMRFLRHGTAGGERGNTAFNSLLMRFATR